MAPGALLRSTWVRTVLALFFCLSGAFATLLLLWGTPSFWYFPCAVLWTLSGFIWLVRPSLAAGLSAFPVLGIAVMMVQTLPHFRQTDYSYRLLLLCVVTALAVIATSFRKREGRKVMPVAISFSLVLMAFVVDRLFTHKLAVHSYSMSWSANGVAPWGDVETDEKGEPPVVIYRRVNQGYCYDAIFSPELRARLTASNKPVITVQYNVFSDFGHERGYNVRAVDGLVFNHGYRPLRPGARSGGNVMHGSGSGDCQR